MERIKIKKIVKKYSDKLKENNFPFSSIYLFGSQIKGTAHKDSDIDIAVISPKFQNRFARNWNKLWCFRDGIDDRIEPHGFTVKDFENMADPLVYEIRKTGLIIA